MTSDPRTTLKAAGLVIGVGMGGFFDGILFHQILQLHNMLSGKIATDNLIGAKVNMVWDGIFHAAMWIVVAIGIGFLWRAAKQPNTLLSGRVLCGSMLWGWGLFNVIEGIVDHHILNLHHVYERLGQSIFDYVFLLWGAAMIVAGWMMTRARGVAR